MDQLDENLLQLKRRVDARIEQMLIIRWAQATETQALVTSDEGSSAIFGNPANLDLDAHTRPALPLPHGDDPTVAHGEMGLVRPNPKPTSAFSQLQEEATTLTAAERMAEYSFEKVTSTSAEHDPTLTILTEGILDSPRAIIRQGFLYRVIGRLLARKS